MKTVWKYQITSDRQRVDMPEGSRIVHVETQGGEAFLWAEVHTERTLAQVDLAIVGTGREIPDGGVHVGTFQAPPFVWHIYEVSHEGTELWDTRRGRLVGGTTDRD